MIRFWLMVVGLVLLWLSEQFVWAFLAGAPESIWIVVLFRAAAVGSGAAVALALVLPVRPGPYRWDRAVAIGALPFLVVIVGLASLRWRGPLGDLAALVLPPVVQTGAAMMLGVALGRRAGAWDGGRPHSPTRRGRKAQATGLGSPAGRNPA
jgi:hypothetical protein